MRLPPILYEDKDVFVFNKPTGLLVHGDGRSREATLADMLARRYPKMRSVGEPMRIRIAGREKMIYRPGIVHRLDKGTSGALLVAKNQPAFEFLKNQFESRSVEKKYLTIVYGKMKNVRGIIDRPIGRSRSDFRKWSATRGARGQIRPAMTEYEVLKNFSADGTDFALLEVFPKTGRTHQIRVHLKAVNHPVVGDALYAGKKIPSLGFTRPALHAAEISFNLPTGRRITVKAPLPGDFKKVAGRGRL